MADPTPQPLAGAQDEVAELLSDLIRIDTTNTGDTATSAGERAAAEWVACKLAEVGIESEIHESQPGRASLVTRIPGADRSVSGARPARCRREPPLPWRASQRGGRAPPS